VTSVSFQRSWLTDTVMFWTDTYTSEELVRCSWWALTGFSGPRQIFVGVRDRAMLLLGATTAFRGEGLRMLQLSDLFLSSAFLDATQEGKKVPVSGPLALFAASLLMS